jgi:hypothetical protein
MGNYNQLHLYLIKFTLLMEEFPMGKITRPLVCLLAIVASLILPLPLTGADEQPDLQPTQIAVSNLYAGVSNTVTVIVANNNNATATNFDVKLEVGNVTIGNSTVSNILPKNDSWYYPAYVNFNWIPAAAGNYTLQATVDSIGNVTESNETNNHLEQNVTVSALSPITVKVRVEGQTANIWSGNLTFQNSTITDKLGAVHNVNHPTALGALTGAAQTGGFTYVVANYFAPLDFVEAVAGDANAGMNGWLYLVNWVSPPFAAVDYTLTNNDEVIWYYGGYMATPLRISTDATSLTAGGNFTATVETLNGTAWEGVPGATVHADSHIFTTDSDGQVENITLSPGGYSLYAEKGDYTQFVRSNRQTVIIYLPLNLQPGWNFISVPKKLASGYATAQQLFGSVNTAVHSIFLYNAATGWAAMGNDTVVAPLDGIWIYSANATELHPVFDVNPRQVPPTKQLAAGWNAIGFSDFTAASANSALTSVEAKWATIIGFDAAAQTYEVSVINNAPDGDPHSEKRNLTCWKGYWIYMTGAGELAAISS